MALCNGFVLQEATIDQIQDALAKGMPTSEQLVTCYMQIVYQTDEYINSLLQSNPDALDIARGLDAERQNGTVRGPLHGIPFTVKDNIATADKMEITAGSWALQESIVPRDAHVVAKLREPGAVLFGKATLSEWADMRSNNYSEGYSGRGGQCRSAYNFTVNPGGSSSGSAVGVAANAIAFSLGSETDGSVINPAERNAIVGIKPTVGRTSRNGVIPESEHQDTIGVFGRTVRDAVYILDAIYGQDPRDNYTLVAPDVVRGFTQYMANRTALATATFGIPWNSFWVYADNEQIAALLEIVELMKSAGATIVNNTELSNYETIVSPDGWNWDYGTTRGFANESEYSYIKVDFYNNIMTYLAELNNTNIRSLGDIVQYNYDNDGSEGCYPWPLRNSAFYSGQDGFLASLATKGIQDETYWQALAFCQKATREDGIGYALKYDGGTLDGLLVPPGVAQAPQIAAQAGYPMITIPASVHSSSGMPFRLRIMQTAWAEGALIKWASTIEDLQEYNSFKYQRTLPTWPGYLARNIPVN